MNSVIPDSEAFSATTASLPSLDWAHLIVREWFVRRLGSPTEPQEQGWPHILAGKTTLISAPTGSGKTLAAFLACIDRLVRKALAGELRIESKSFTSRRSKRSAMTFRKISKSRSAKSCNWPANGDT